MGKAQSPQASIPDLQCIYGASVGGIKEKVIAAATAGIKRVMLPARNKRDFDDIPEDIRRNLEFVWLTNLDEAVKAALEPSPAAARTAA